MPLTLFRLRKGGGGGGGKKPFAALVSNFNALASASPKLLSLNQNHS